MNSRTINVGPGLMRKASLGGVVITPFTRSRPVQSSPAVSTHPVKLSDATAAEVAKVKIQFGMVNGIIPGGMGDPSETSLTLTVASSGLVVLAVTTNTTGVATSATIYISANSPADTSTLGHIALGYVTKNTGPVSVTCSQSVSGSLQHQKCGYSHLFGKV
jgi:hypothetical protein